jgi:hypothetical protein
MCDADGADLPRMVDGVSGPRRCVRPSYRWTRREMPNRGCIGHMRTGRANAMRVMNANGSIRLDCGSDAVAAGERQLGGGRRGDDEAAGPCCRLDRRRRCSRCSSCSLRRRRAEVGRRLRGCGLRDGLLRRRSAWQERKRIHVALLVRRQAHAEVDVRLAQVDDAARPDRADDGAFGDVRAAPDSDRPEVDERDRVSRRRLDRNGLAAGRNGSGERHGPLRRRNHVRARPCCEIDAAVLSGRVRMRAVERERTQNGSVDRPRPGLRRRGQDERAERDDSDSP